MTGIDEARKKAEELKTMKAEADAIEEGDAKQALELVRERMAAMYKGDAEASIGTEDINAGDLNIPQLKLVQPNKVMPLADGKRANDGWFYRTDTKQQMETVDVVLLVVKKQTGMNFKGDKEERKHVYFGLYDSTTDPFRMYCRGWSLSGSREFLTEVKRIQAHFKVPMFALLVTLRSKPQSGTTDDGADYSVYQTVFEIKKAEDGETPLVETNSDRASVLREFVDRFERIAVTPAAQEEDKVGAVPPDGQPRKEEEIPF